MLVLSRKKGESIVIGDQIEVKILAVDGDQVKVGIVAPNTVKIYRSELLKEIQQQNREALEVELSFFKKLSEKK